MKSQCHSLSFKYFLREKSCICPTIPELQMTRDTFVFFYFSTNCIYSKWNEFRANNIKMTKTFFRHFIFYFYSIIEPFLPNCDGKQKEGNNVFFLLATLFIKRSSLTRTTSFVNKKSVGERFPFFFCLVSYFVFFYLFIIIIYLFNKRYMINSLT